MFHGEYASLHFFYLWDPGFSYLAAAAKSLQSCPTLATPWTAAYQALPSMGFFQARVLEWGAIAFSD